MKSSADVLKSMQGRRRWLVAHERSQRDATSLALCDYLEMLRPIAQALSEALCALDLSGHIQFASPKMQRLAGCSELELLGRDIHSLLQFSENDFDSRRSLHDALTRCAQIELGASELRRGDGAIVVVRCTLHCIAHEGQPVGAMLIVAESGRAGEQAPEQSQPQDGSATAGAEERGAERRLRILESIGDIAIAQLPLDDLLRTLIESLRREMALENIAIFLLNEEGDTLIGHVASGAGAETADSIHLPLGETMVGRAMSARRTVFIPDVNQVARQWVRFSPEIRARMNVQSIVIVPMTVDERLIGAIYLGASLPNRFSQEDARLAELVGERAALAIERAHANDEAARAHERLRFLNDASDALNATLDYHDTTRRLTTIVTPALADACAIYLLEDDGLLRKVATQAPARGLLAPDPEGAALQRLVERMEATVEVNPDDIASAIGRCIQTLAPVIERDPHSDNPSDSAGKASAEDCFCVSAPLVVRQHALGVLYLALRPGKEYSDGDLALIQGLAERAAIAIDNARLYIETQQALATGSATATQLDTIFNATDVGIYVTDANGGILRINPYGAELLGLEQSALGQGVEGGQETFELRTTEGEVIAPEREPLQLARLLGRPIEQRLVIHRFDTGKDIQALTRCSPWRDGRNQIAGAIAVITDITEIYELERQKDEFLGIASHELKTPLTSLKILAQMLARKMEASGEQRELEQAQRMQVAITRMERLIRDLLDVSLIQEGKLALHEELTDLGAICVEAVHEQEMLTQRAIRFSEPEGGALPIYADRERIYQVISNLLSNALKYSPATEKVSVRARATHSECIVSVSDHGPGVPPEAVERIFDRFYRVPGMQVQSGSGVGLGLGLHISKDIVNRHGGRIWVESKLGHGSTFSVALPRAGALPVS